MAEFGAHMTSTQSLEGSQPSIFEVLAQESLMSSLKPAFIHILRIIAQRNPERLGFLYAKSEELYTLLDLILQYYYLKFYDASFAENFYGIRRVPDQQKETSADTRSLPLPSRLRLKSLFFLVVVPYLKNKCDEYFEREQQKQAECPQQARTARQKLLKAFLAVYPVFHLMWEGTMLSYQFLFMISKAKHHSVFLPLTGVHLQNLTEPDIDRHNLSHLTLDLTNKSFVGKMASLLLYTTKLVAVGVSSGLSVGVFFLQFLEWWYASDQKATSLTALPTPDPPQPQRPDSLPKMNNICPLCNRIRTNDTVLSVTGYVFCYPCVYRHVSQHHTCPITNYPAEIDHLVKLYLPDS